MSPAIWALTTETVRPPRYCMSVPELGGAPSNAPSSSTTSSPSRSTVSVVAYDDEVSTVAEPATGPAQAGLTFHIKSIQPGGSTNLRNGWLRGRELVARGKREGGVNRVVLLTDGLANAGITAPEQLLGLCRTACGAGITTTTIGFGADYDEKLLRGMADAGGANTWYIERADQAADVFAEELEGLLTLCAQTLSVEIRPTDAVTLTAVRHQYPLTALGDGALGSRSETSTPASPSRCWRSSLSRRSSMRMGA